MRITSRSYENGAPIPKKYTCEGENVSPSIEIFDVPMGCKSFALIMEDPDAPSGVFDHWIVWNIHPTTTEIAEGEKLIHQGKNGFGSFGYKGPCPPHGKAHRYYVTLFALDAVLELKNGGSKEELLKEMENHIIERAELMGTYQR